MKTELECYPCLVKHALGLIQDIDADETQRYAMMSEILRILSTTDTKIPPPQLTRLFYDSMAEVMGDDTLDPYRGKKDLSTATAATLLRQLKESGELLDGSFESKVRLAIAGNILDFSIYGDLSMKEAMNVVREAFVKPLDGAGIAELKRRMDEATNILYLLDNCGEAVFDSVLLEDYRGKVTLGVRGKAASNDITRVELEASGLGGYPVVDNGCRMPGVIPSLASEEMRQALSKADLIVAKGQGNFECLNDSGLPIVFLFMAKCPVVVKAIGAEPRSLQVRFA